MMWPAMTVFPVRGGKTIRQNGEGWPAEGLVARSTRYVCGKIVEYGQLVRSKAHVGRTGRRLFVVLVEDPICRRQQAVRKRRRQ